jgi:hypothetical protein
MAMSQLNRRDLFKVAGMGIGGLIANTDVMGASLSQQSSAKIDNDSRPFTDDEIREVCGFVVDDRRRASFYSFGASPDILNEVLSSKRQIFLSRCCSNGVPCISDLSDDASPTWEHKPEWRNLVILDVPQHGKWVVHHAGWDLPKSCIRLKDGATWPI